MQLTTIIGLLIFTILTILWLLSFNFDAGFLSVILFCFMIVCLLVTFIPTAEETAEKERIEQLNNQPKPILEKDGCTVYKFHDDRRDHYFTRCPSNTITEKTYQESCGKNCTRVESELIETTN